MDAILYVGRTDTVAPAFPSPKHQNKRNQRDAIEKNAIAKVFGCHTVPGIKIPFILIEWANMARRAQAHTHTQRDSVPAVSKRG